MKWPEAANAATQRGLATYRSDRKLLKPAGPDVGL
jgi:hypothetical protein